MQYMWEENKNKLNADIVELKGVAIEDIRAYNFVLIKIDKYSGSVTVENMKIDKNG